MHYNYIQMPGPTRREVHIQMPEPTRREVHIQIPGPAHAQQQRCPMHKFKSRRGAVFNSPFKVLRLRLACRACRKLYSPVSMAEICLASLQRKLARSDWSNPTPPPPHPHPPPLDTKLRRRTDTVVVVLISRLRLITD